MSVSLLILALVSSLLDSRPPLLWVQVPGATGHGSGVVIRADGYAITCRHVVGSSQKATAWLKDGTPLTCEVVAVDVANDLALLKLPEGLESVRKGNPPDDKLPEFSGAEVELADVIIRIMDNAHARNWRVAEAVEAKMAFNKTRPRKHGKLF